MSQILQLSDGRRLSYIATGPAHGTPVIYCHGAIGTALGRAVDLDALSFRLGVRYIAPSRPGMGGSDASPGRTILDFAADVRELADALSLARFAVVGVSAGGPYALAIARDLPERVSRVAVCSSLSPLCAPHRAPGMQRRVRLAGALVTHAPGACVKAGDAVVPLIARHPGLLSRVIAAHAASCERRLLARPQEREAASAGFLDAARDGVSGMLEDYLVYSRQWGFSAAEVRSEVQLWHGLEDRLVPIEHALALAASLPRCRLFLDPDEGHHFFRSSLARILAVLVGRGGEDRAEVETTIDRALSRVQRRVPHGSVSDGR
ncbi:MAG: alpha/beta fold hydrolase [Solirubrobacteraceae bacterium]